MIKTSLKIGALFITLTFMLPATLSSMPKARAKKKPAEQGPAAEGKALFNHNCAMCHNANNTKVKIGPGLEGLFKNKELPASHKPVTEDNVRDQIENGNPKAKPMPMPAFADKLSKEDIENLLAYLKTL